MNVILNTLFECFVSFIVINIHDRLAPLQPSSKEYTLGIVSSFITAIRTIPSEGMHTDRYIVNRSVDNNGNVIVPSLVTYTCNEHSRLCRESRTAGTNRDWPSRQERKFQHVTIGRRRYFFRPVYVPSRLSRRARARARGGRGLSVT